MTKTKDEVVKGKETLGFGTDDLTGEEAHKIAQELVKEFISTKQRMLTDDRKLNAIGKALIEQKGALDKILSVQNSHGKELSESLEVVAEKQEGVSGKITSITQSMSELQEAKEEQEKFLGELGHFKGKHDELSRCSKAQSAKSVERLETISEQVAKLFEQINSVDIEERVEDISKRTVEVDELLKDHANKQEQTREDASRNMLDLLAEVTSFRRQLSDEGLVGRLADIQLESYDSKQKIDTLNEKFDTFIEVYELSKVETKNELEDIFTGNEEGFVSKVEEPSAEEEMENIVTSGELEDVFSDEIEEMYSEIERDADKDGIEEPVEDLVEEPLDYKKDIDEETLPNLSADKDRHCELSAGETIKSLSLEEIDEIPVYGRVEKEDSNVDSDKTDKKQGFFSKLFGGR